MTGVVSQWLQTLAHAYVLFSPSSKMCVPFIPDPIRQEPSW
jgi:hypothetical protein